MAVRPEPSPARLGSLIFWAGVVLFAGLLLVFLISFYRKGPSVDGASGMNRAIGAGVTILASQFSSV
ncbi:MAG TPA: hypothetical protein VM554_07105 [Acidisarcina sp.]|nr:hypothetical protein [Acidisarcina sp.]